MKIRVHVTKKDIREGQAGRSRFCPVARALGRKIHSEFSVSVGLYQVQIAGNALHFHSIDLPPSVESFVRHFDAVAAGEPFSFTIDMPAEFLRKP